MLSSKIGSETVVRNAATVVTGGTLRLLCVFLFLLVLVLLLRGLFFLLGIPTLLLRVSLLLFG